MAFGCWVWMSVAQPRAASLASGGAVAGRFSCTSSRLPALRGSCRRVRRVGLSESGRGPTWLGWWRGVCGVQAESNQRAWSCTSDEEVEREVRREGGDGEGRLDTDVIFINCG